MYNAHGNPNDDNSHGSTQLHLDVTSAVNIMLYAADFADGRSGGALWHIFPISTLPSLRDFLRNEPTIGFREPGDPIHNQGIYLTPTLLRLLAEKHDIRPFIIHQKPGDAIFIPAGCAHQVTFHRVLVLVNLIFAQVSNMTDSIKIACDFLDVESLPASAQLLHEFRMQRLVNNWPEDVLQFEVTLWHAWTSLYKQKNQLRDVISDGLSMAPIHAPHPVLDPTLAMNIGTSTVALITQHRQARKREKRRLHRKDIADTRRSHEKPGHDCRCPLCPQANYFNKRGLLLHMWVYLYYIEICTSFTYSDSSHRIAVHAPSIPSYMQLETKEFLYLVDSFIS